ncbi:hypothetical protein ATANTOWER_011161 [Ataeniobius toweri]|uniref:Uncharacterized protein n=1 Tax=Ataeniobius toweri TaxID=208326 RepID=A0ABU7BMN9_9TELE|nr:hypothetical protein [Ataeniobius toweri]
MFRAPVRSWLKALHSASLPESLLQLPGICKPKEGTNLFSSPPASKTPACPPTNFTYTSWKEIQRNNHHLTTTSPVKLSVCGVTYLPLETPLHLNNQQQTATN